MRPDKLALGLKTHTRFSQSILSRLKSECHGSIENIGDECIGGVIRDGQFGWIAYGAYIEVFSLKTGNKVASYSFDNSHRLSNTVITCVTEIIVTDINSCILIVGVQCSPIGGLLYIFSVQGSRIVHRIDVIDKITSCCFISTAACKRSNLVKFDGCVAVGTAEGKVLLLDLNLRKCKGMIYRRLVYNHDSDTSTCKIVLSTMNYKEIVNHHKQAQNENINFGIQLEILPKSGPILSILCLPQLLTIAVGLDDGRMVLYNLCDLNAFHLAYPPERNSSLVKLTYLEPADDPRACVYIWAFHANSNAAIAVMHSIAFEAKILQDDEYLYENFQSCSPRLTIPICKKGTIPVACQSISKIVSDEEDELLSLCLLGWYSKTTPLFMLLFDLNQWYKEQMPEVCDWQEYPSYLAPFPIETNDTPLDIWINPRSVATFNSIQRPEEHFYPTSLSFELLKLTPSLLERFYWPGLQNKALEKLNATGAIAILEPNECFTDILETSLIPQLSDQNFHSYPSTRVKQEFLLSMALEYNCMGLLKECARLWADGSHMGHHPNEGLTLSTLTDWIWAQATLIKDCCNNLCVPLFDHSGITLDLRSRKILAHCLRQLKLLAELLHMIVTNCRQYIPDDIFDTLCCQRNSIRMTSEYQEVLQWLLNMGLLPEVAWGQFTRHNSQLSLSCTLEMLNDVSTPVPYPYHILHEYYTAQRQKFYEIDRNYLTPKTNSCKCLYIDTFIEKECNSHQLRTEWKNGLGDGLYPPPSLQAMLRILLVPGIPLENKYMLFVYLFLDLNMALEDERYFRIVQNLIKFPAVFKLNPTLIKTTQAFWNLDHKEYETAIDELISPLTNDRLISSWQQELLINTLLIQDMPNLALRAIRAPGPPINTILEIRTFMANNLITEAFELQRAKFDENLLWEFFKGCHEQKKWNYVLGLALTEREGEILIKFLNKCHSLLSENLHLLYLLQRNKYIEALTYMSNLNNSNRPHQFQRELENTQNMIFSAYKLAMGPSDRILSDLFLSMKDRISPPAHNKLENTKPLSSDLNSGTLDSNSNIIGGVFHRAILSAKSTSISIEQPTISNADMQGYVPFLSKPQIDFDYFEFNNFKTVTYPKTYICSSKRRKEVSYDDNRDSEYNQPAAKRQRTDSFSIETIDRPLKRTMGMNASLLTTFKLKNYSTPTQLPIELNADDSREADGEIDETVNLLSTPVVKSSRMEKHATNCTDRGQTPQSILKHRHNEHYSIQSRRSISPTLTVNSARRSVDFDERSFRFGQNLDTSDDYRLTAIPESVIDEDRERISPYSGIKSRDSIHFPDTSVLSTSNDEFYSPENTKLSDAPTESNIDTHVDDADMPDYSRISHTVEEPIVQSKQIKSRRKLRSQTPEIADQPLSSTRVTRSKSKQPINKNTDLDLPSNRDAQLDTSTPLRSISGRPSLKSLQTLTKPLSISVIESNAIKTLIKRNKAIKTADTVNETTKSYLNASDDSCSSIQYGDPQVYRKNVLEDNSEISESFIKRYTGEKTIYSDGSSVFEPNVRPTRNVLQDSSSFSYTSDGGKRTPVENVNQIETEEKMDQEEEEEEEGDGEQEMQLHKELNTNESIIEPENEISADDKSINDKQLTTENINEDTNKISANENEPVEAENSKIFISDEDDEKTEIIESGAIPAVANEPQNILTDTSMISKSFLKQYTETKNITIYSETSTFYSSHTKNILEDSSFGPALAQHTLKDHMIPVVVATDTDINSDDDDNASDGSQVECVRDEDEIEIDDKSSSGEKLSKSDSVYGNIDSSSSGNPFLYEENSDENDIDSVDDSDISSNDFDAKPDKLNKTDDNNVINISSTSSESSNTTKQSNSINIIENDDYTNDISENSYAGGIDFASPEELDVNIQSQVDNFPTELPPFNSQLTIPAYNFTDLLTAPMEDKEESVSAGPSDLIQPQESINDMLYGDLDMGDINSVDANNDAIYLDSFTGPGEETAFETQSNDLNIAIQPTGTLIEITSTVSDADDIKVSKDVTEKDDIIMEQVVESTSNLIETPRNLNEAVIVEDSSIDNVTETTEVVSEVSNILENAIIEEELTSKIESTDPKTISEVPDDANQNNAKQLYDVKTEDKSESTLKSVDTPAKRQRRSSSVSSSQAPDQYPIVARSTRSKSVLSDQTDHSLRSRRAASHQSLTDISEANILKGSPAGIKTRRQSFILEAVAAESPKTPSRGRRKTISESSDVELASISSKINKDSEQLKSTPRRSSRLRESDVDSTASTPSRRSVERELSATPTKRNQKTKIEQISLETATKQIHKRNTRSSKLDDDAISETSSIASSVQSRKSVTDHDDDKLSIKSTKSTKRPSSRAAITLPIITEDEQEKATTSGTPSKHTPVEYLASSRRLTRAQLATMEKYSLEKRRHENEVASTPRRITTRTRSTSMASLNEFDDDQHNSDSDKSDARSVTSNTSKLSKLSKSSMASRSSKRLQAKKN